MPFAIDHKLFLHKFILYTCVPLIVIKNKCVLIANYAFYESVFPWYNYSVIVQYFCVFPLSVFNKNMFINSLCNCLLPLAARYVSLMASTSLMYFYYLFCIFIDMHIVR